MAQHSDPANPQVVLGFDRLRSRRETRQLIDGLYLAPRRTVTFKLLPAPPGEGPGPSGPAVGYDLSTTINGGIPGGPRGFISRLNAGSRG